MADLPRPEDAEPASCLDEKINWLTDEQRIGYGQRREDPAILMRPAEKWNDGAR